MADNEYLQTVIVLSGGLSHERDVSLRSGRRVSQALRSRGIEVVESDVDSTLLSQLAELTGSVVFPLLHGEAGEDGALREVFELLGVPSSVRSDRPAGWHSTSRSPPPSSAPRAFERQLRWHCRTRRFASWALRFSLTPWGSDRLSHDDQAVPLRIRAGLQQGHPASELPAAMVGAYAYGSVAVIEEFIEGNRSDCCRRGPRQRADRSSRGGNSARIGRLRLRGSIHRRRHPVPLPGRGGIRGGKRLRRRGSASARIARSPRSVTHRPHRRLPTASRSSSKSMSRRA